mmetsp:Transcript_84241/g.180524  ORF Transcript_84241/g.180524 Transcript_84241/m.180524 type:complete len:320 (-) Transcript_84241:85-1044(-)
MRALADRSLRSSAERGGGQLSTQPKQVNQEGVDFLRVQKTGGTTLGAHIMPKFCGPHCRGDKHLSWSQMGKSGNKMDVTLLRDPVERTLSEFHFMRTDDGKEYSRQGQWHFSNEKWLDKVQNTPDVDEAWDVYLHGDPLNPSRNRQALYILGFSHWEDKKGGEKHGLGAKYDWTHEHNKLLARAKRHLRKLSVFGITDCYLASMQVIAQTFGWDAQAVVNMAKHTHHHEQTPQLAVIPSSPFANAPSPIFFGNATLSMTSNATSPILFGNATLSNTSKGKWRRLVDPHTVKIIEQQNALDVDLYNFALATFKERFGEDC